MTEENKEERRKYHKPVVLGLTLFFTLMLLVRFLESLIQPTKTNMMQFYVNLNNFVFQGFAMVSVYFCPYLTLPLMMIDSVAKIAGNVLKSWNEDPLINKCI